MTTDTPPPPKRSRAPKAERRDQLIQATIDSLARKGYASTTMADVARGANLSQGIVNFHFESKEKLFTETLIYLSGEYATNWKSKLAEAENTPTERLLALIEADLAAEIFTPRKVAAWFAVMSEAKGKPALQDLGSSRDELYIAALEVEIEGLRRAGDYLFDTSKTAAAIYAMQEGLWFRMTLNRADFSRETALSISLATLGSLFPKHFDKTGKPHPAS
jgi:AcrR family transcriptional regulator